MFNLSHSSVLFNTTCLGDRSFTAAGPTLWNGLPTYLHRRWSDTLERPANSSSPPLVRHFGTACQLIFTAAGPTLRNGLPTHLHQPDLSLGQFRRALKTHLFLAAWLRRLVTICFLAPLYKYPYLLTLPTSFIHTYCSILYSNCFGFFGGILFY